MKEYLRHIAFMILSIAGSLWLVSCADEPISEAAGTGSGVCGSDEGGLMFAIGDTRAFDRDHFYELSTSDEEIVINPDNFHVVVFSNDGQVLQEWANQELTEFEEYDPDMKLVRTKYFVKIPRQDMTQKVINYIRENSFKIAVFANWDGYPDFTTTSFIDPANRIDHNNIFYITHCREDGSYDSGTVDGQMNDKDVFGFITGQGAKMGIAQEWVCERFKNDIEADAAIRSNYDVENTVFHSNSKPTITNYAGVGTEFSDMKDYDYYNVWEIWNFGGTNNTNDAFYNTPVNDIKKAWRIKNSDCYDTFGYKGSVNAGEGIMGPLSVRGLTVNGNSNNAYKYRDSNGYGVILTNSNRGTGIRSIDVSEGSYIHFQIPADGYVRVKCRSTNNSGGAIVARRGALNSTDEKNVHVASQGLSSNGIQEFTLSWAKDSYEQELVRVTGEPLDFTLYATGGDVIIYEIEYIKSHMIQSVDRQMINPASTPEGGISMYGIQDFEPLPVSVWPEGTTFNMSRNVSTHTGPDKDNYLYRTISLLRSVAKVEVLLPTSLFPEPSHMYMRTINRFSRSAPMDVFTPTNIIWDGWDNTETTKYKYKTSSIRDAWWSWLNTRHTHYYNEVVGVDNEYNNIRTAGFTYEDGNSSVGDYRNAVAWLFGIWYKEYGWNWNSYPITVKNSGVSYPRVFNTRISRSDYGHMIDGGIKNIDGTDHYYYYAYLPEKNVTDPNDKGTLGESPKVMRIEMRFGDRNSDDNLDDNASYRIYFTPGGKGGGINNRDDFDGNMEKGNSDANSTPMQNLKNIYPVMRNHLYRFKVTGIEMNELQVQFEAQGPDTRDVGFTFN